MGTLPSQKSGVSKLAILGFSMLPILLGACMAGFSLFLIQKQERLESVNRAMDVSQFELKRMIGLFNFRLNLLRDELLDLYRLQDVSRTFLSELSRESLLFNQHESFSAFAILTKLDSTWEVHKYFLNRKQDTKLISIGSEQNLPFLTLLKEAASRLGNGQFTMEDASSISREGQVLVTFPHHEAGLSIALTAVSEPTSLFRFCRYSDDRLGEMAARDYVVSSQGQILCHSISKLENTSIKSEPYFIQMKSFNNEGGVVRYVNFESLPVLAYARKIGPVYFVSEVTEAQPWSPVLLGRGVRLGLIAILVVSLLVSVFLTRLALAKSGDRSHEIPPKNTGPSLDGLGVELSEFTKLRAELKEMEKTLLEVQTQQALLLTFQKGLGDLFLQGKSQVIEFAKFLIQHLSTLQVPVGWFFVNENHQLIPGPTAHGLGWAGEFNVRLPEHANPDELSSSRELCGKLQALFGLKSIFIQPVYSGNKLFGLIVVGPSSKDENTWLEEILPPVAQILSLSLAKIA